MLTRKPSYRSIVCAAARSYGENPSAILSLSKRFPLSNARAVSLYLARTLRKDTYQAIGLTFGMHHSSVMDACRRVASTPQLMARAKAIADHFEPSGSPLSGHSQTETHSSAHTQGAVTPNLSNPPGAFELSASGSFSAPSRVF